MKLRAPNILFYDIETCLPGFDGFGLGKQVVRHNQLQPGRSNYDIICIQYMWETDKKATVLSWIGKDTSSANIISEFDKIVAKADIIIGKNSDRFDAKYMNTVRLLNNLDPAPHWMMPKTKDDVESQLRRFFYLPSYSLDYVSQMLGLGGKDKMEMSDWRDIRDYKEILDLKYQGINNIELDIVSRYMYNKSYNTVMSLGAKKLRKMCHYGAKDVVDTKQVWKKIKRYCKPVLNMSTFYGHQDKNYLRCRQCGGVNLVKNGKDYLNAGIKRRMKCKDCKIETRFSMNKHGKLGRGE